MSEFRVFEGCYDGLYLSGGVSLWTKSFLAKVEDSVLFTVASE